MLKIIHRIAQWFHSCPPQEDLFEFALDGLEMDEKGKVRGHLRECYACREQVKEYAWVSEGIALGAPQLDPPGDLCSKVKDRIRQDADAGRVEIRYVERPLEGRVLFWNRLGPALAGLSLVSLAFAAGIFVAYRPSHVDPLLYSADAALRSDSARQIQLISARASQEDGSLIVAEGSREAILRVNGMPACQKGKSYVLWMQPQQGQPRRLGSFHASGERASSYLISLPEPFACPGRHAEFKINAEDMVPGKDKPVTALAGSLNL